MSLLLLAVMVPGLLRVLSPVRLVDVPLEVPHLLRDPEPLAARSPLSTVARVLPSKSAVLVALPSLATVLNNQPAVRDLLLLLPKAVLVVLVLLHFDRLAISSPRLGFHSFLDVNIVEFRWCVHVE